MYYDAISLSYYFMIYDNANYGITEAVLRQNFNEGAMQRNYKHQPQTKSDSK